MPRSNGTQTRTFTYQAGTNWLLTATNPENGTVTYTRDKVGHVKTRVDAMGQTTSYYLRRLQPADAGHEGAGVAGPPDPCQTENYYYDGQTVDGYSTGASIWQADGGDLWVWDGRAVERLSGNGG